MASEQRIYFVTFFRLKLSSKIASHFCVLIASQSRETQRNELKCQLQ